MKIHQKQVKSHRYRIADAKKLPSDPSNRPHEASVKLNSVSKVSRAWNWLKAREQNVSEQFLETDLRWERECDQECSVTTEEENTKIDEPIVKLEIVEEDLAFCGTECSRLRVLWLMSRPWRTESPESWGFYHSFAFLATIYDSTQRNGITSPRLRARREACGVCILTKIASHRQIIQPPCSKACR